LKARRCQATPPSPVTHTHTYTHTHTSTHTSTHTDTQIYTYTHTHTHKHTERRAHSHIHTHARVQPKPKRANKIDAAVQQSVGQSVGQSMKQTYKRTSTNTVHTHIGVRFWSVWFTISESRVSEAPLWDPLGVAFHSQIDSGFTSEPAGQVGAGSYGFQFDIVRHMVDDMGRTNSESILTLCTRVCFR
jgi:hypothetical protein